MNYSKKYTFDVYCKTDFTGGIILHKGRLQKWQTEYT